MVSASGAAERSMKLQLRVGDCLPGRDQLRVGLESPVTEWWSQECPGPRPQTRMSRGPGRSPRRWVLESRSAGTGEPCENRSGQRQDEDVGDNERTEDFVLGANQPDNDDRELAVGDEGGAGP
jgi:hypothetical protein